MNTFALNERINFFEIFKLHDYLCKEKIIHTFSRLYDGYQIKILSGQDCICSIILHSGSYGNSQGLLEIMGIFVDESIDDSVEGYLSADEIINRIKLFEK